MIKQLEKRLKKTVHQYVDNGRTASKKIGRKKSLLSKRNSEILNVKAIGKIKDQIAEEDLTKIYYDVHFSYLIRQKTFYYLEEEIEKRVALFEKNKLISDDETPFFVDSGREILEQKSDSHEDLERIKYRYDRLKAVRYAERWWNDYNPQYKKFTDDCTNYISQCLRAGDAPMRGFGDRSKGWWYSGDSWSYSWSVAHSLRWYLATSKSGLRAKEVDDPRKLQLGDVICYDFQGNGRFDHNTIVTGKDIYGFPLVNAHTHNSRMRYWSYEDSSAYTPNIQYRFYSIVDDE